MAGFAAGRLQTGGRASASRRPRSRRRAQYVASAAVRQPIGEYGLTQYQLGRMATRSPPRANHLRRRRARWTPTSARAAPVAAMAKLFACDVAV